MNKSDLIFAIRWIAYIIFIALIAMVPRLDVQFFLSNPLTSEFSWIEIGQVILLIASITFFALSTRLQNKADPQSPSRLGWLLCGFFGCLLIRELDYYGDHYLFDGSWQTGVTIVLLSVGFYTRKHFDQLLNEFRSFIKTNSFGILGAGLLVVVVYSRLFGKTDFWESVLTENYTRSVKDIAEEGVELLGIAIVFIGSIEYLLNSLTGRSESLETASA